MAENKKNNTPVEIKEHKQEKHTKKEIETIFRRNTLATLNKLDNEALKRELHSTILK